MAKKRKNKDDKPTTFLDELPTGLDAAPGHVPESALGAPGRDRGFEYAIVLHFIADGDEEAKAVVDGLVEALYVEEMLLENMEDNPNTLIAPVPSGTFCGGHYSVVPGTLCPDFKDWASGHRLEQIIDQASELVGTVAQ